MTKSNAAAASSDDRILARRRHVAVSIHRFVFFDRPIRNAPEQSDDAAESRADFIHKLGVAFKEQRETRGWLRFIIKARLLPEKRIAPLL